MRSSARLSLLPLFAIPLAFMAAPGPDSKPLTPAAPLTSSAREDGHLELPAHPDRDRWELRAEQGRLWLLDRAERRDLGATSGLRSIRSPLPIRLTGSLEASRALSVEAPEISLAGALRAPSLTLRAAGMINLEASGSLSLAPGAALRLEADYLSLVGPIQAPGAQLSVQARGFLHQGSITLDARGEHAAGQARIECDRYVGSLNGALLARDPAGRGGSVELLARTSLFSSGRFDVSGKRGGSAWLSGRDTRLVVADLDASGAEEAGTLRVGAEAKDARPDGTNTWHAESLLSTRGTRLRAESAAGDAGEIVLGATRSTRFEGRLLVSSAAGQGGRVEVSSAGELHFGGQVSAQGACGPGALLLDPQNLDLNDGTGVLAQFPLVDPNPNDTGYGKVVLALSGGNVVVTDPSDNLGATNAGAAYLFNGTTGALISSLTGSTANDQVSEGGAVALTNGNYVVRSQSWVNGAIAGAGAATWAAAATGTSGPVSTTNSLVGTEANDSVSISGVIALTNGNYVVLSDSWNDSAIARVGAATWGNGATGISGAVTTANSLHGSTAQDRLGDGVTALTNGNYVVRSRRWDNGGVADAGAATWGNGATGITGAVSAANSLVGTTANDQVSASGVTALSNGNYVVASGSWDNGAVANAGAATWGSGATGISGAVSAANSLVGTTASDQVSSIGVIALSNGNYVVQSQGWDNGGAADAGAATWGNGATGITGAVSAANSLVGTTASDQVSASGVTALSNGNYVVASGPWDNGGVANVGAATWGNGATGITGAVSTANSLHGSTANDQVSSNGVTALTNGNYVVRSPVWDNGGVANAGAATWGNGAAGITGAVSAANSLHGSTANDQVSLSGVTALTNGNYVVRSPVWDNGGVANAGAATWGNGATGITGAVSTANSLHGSTATDQVSLHGVAALSDGSYVVGSGSWDNGAVADAGAATWGNGAMGITGAVSAANSLVGSSAGDQVSSSGPTALTNGDYVVASRDWDNGVTLNAGALSFGRAGGTTGAVGPANSVVGIATTTATQVSGLGSGFAGALQGTRAAVVFPLESTTFSVASGQTITSPTARITQLLSAGTNVTLQASQDITITSPITVNNPTGNGGNLTLIAGRSVIVNGAITSDNGNFEARANSNAAAGVVDADRGAGAGSVQNTATIDAGTGTIRLETQPGTGLTNNTRADYALGTLTAATTTVVPFSVSLSPTAAERGETLTVVGGGLTGATVTVGGVAATTLSVQSNQVQVQVPTGVALGSQAVVLTTPSGSIGVGSVSVVIKTDLAVTKSVDAATPSERDRINYTVQVGNKSTATATGVQLTDALPAGVTLVSAVPSQGSFTQGSGLWSVGSLAPTTTATLTLEVSVDAGTAGTTITNTTSGLAATTFLSGATSDDVGSAAITVAAVVSGGGGPPLGASTPQRVIKLKGKDCSLTQADTSELPLPLLAILLGLFALRLRRGSLA